MESDQKTTHKSFLELRILKIRANCGIKFPNLDSTRTLHLMELQLKSTGVPMVTLDSSHEDQSSPPPLQHKHLTRRQHLCHFN